MSGELSDSTRASAGARDGSPLVVDGTLGRPPVALQQAGGAEPVAPMFESTSDLLARVITLTSALERERERLDLLEGACHAALATGEPGSALVSSMTDLEQRLERLHAAVGDVQRDALLLPSLATDMNALLRRVDVLEHRLLIAAAVSGQAETSKISDWLGSERAGIVVGGAMALLGLAVAVGLFAR